MKKFKISCLNLFPLLLFCFNSYSSVLVDTTLAEWPKEKIYVHFNKFQYLPGDTIWFKIYIVTGINHQLSNLSGVVYAELVNSSGMVLKSHKLRVVSGTASGNMPFDSYAKNEKYAFRAYTKLTLNNAKNPIYYKLLSPFGPDTTQKQPFSFHFFPEGGTILDGLGSKVAYRSVTSSGKSVKSSGTVEDEQGNVITR